MIPVTKTFLPPINEYFKWVETAFKNGWITNRGPLLKELEKELKRHLNVDWITITNNGTMPIQISLKILANNAEVITTPFSYVATTSAILWEGCTPIFVDIDPDFLTIDETKIEQAITEKTTCILATHVFGNPCNIEAIEKIAKKHSLYVIYDAAHCFDVKYNGKSIFEYGDISTCSFHATKLFHTGEGGAMFSSNKEIQKKLFYSHNFGHNGPLEFHGLGINAKSSELHAAMGLSVLPHIEHIKNSRKEIINFYNQNINFYKLKKLKIRKNTEWNYSYYPIIFETEEQLIKAQKLFNENNIYPRRYFYPSLNNLDFLPNKTEMTISESISKRVLCLPLYDSLSIKDLNRICNLINQ